MSTNPFEKIWQDLQSEQQLDALIKDHTKNNLGFTKLIGDLLATRKRPEKILEIGCGTAIETFTLKQRFDHFHVAVDLSLASIELSKKIGAKFGVDKIFGLVNDAFLPCFKNQMFGIIFHQGVMEHFTDETAFLHAQVPLLKEDGFLIVSVPQTYNPYTIYKKIKLWQGKSQYGWESQYSVGRLKRVAKKLNLNIVSYMGYGYAYWEDFGFGKFRNLSMRIIEGNRLKKIKPIFWLAQLSESIWRFLEGNWGQYFMQNICVVFQKK